MKQPQKPENMIDNGQRTQKEANPMETNQNMFSTNDYKIKN